MQLETLLNQIPHLDMLPEEERHRLAAACEEWEFADGQLIIEQGGVGDHAFFVLSGEVQVSTEVAGQQQELRRLQPGDIFGLLALIDDKPRSAFCRAVGPTRVATLSRPIYKRLAGDSAPLALAFQLAIGAQLAQDYRNIAEQVQALLLGA